MSGKQKFTIARKQALATMRDYALRHPDQWVLEIVASAVLCGATQIAVNLDKTRLTVSWVGGERFTTPELDALYDHLFADASDLTARRVQQLALGCNAVLQKRAQRIDIRSGYGTHDSSTRAVVQGSTSEAHDGPAVTGTVVSILLTRSGRRSVADEARILRDRAVFVPVPLFVNDIELFPGADTSVLHAAGLTSSVRVDGAGTRAVIGLARPEMAPVVTIVVGGIVVTRRAIPELGSRTAGVLWDDRLRKSADGADIVVDDAYRAAVARCQAAVLPLLQSAHASVSTAPFVAPALPDSPSALPDPVDQVGARESVSHETIAGWPTDVPVFVVDPDTPLAVDTTLDPTDFPFPVLLVSTTRGAALAARFPEHRFARLTTSEDARFLRDLRLRTHPVWHSAPVPLSEGRLSLDITVMDAEPVAATPVLRVVDGRTMELGSLPLALPGTRVRIQAETMPPLEHCVPAVRSALAQAVRELGDVPVRAALIEAIVTTWTIPAFVATDTGARVVLSLPPELADIEDTVLSTPIGGGPSPNALAAVMGTDSVISLPPESFVDRWLSLEERLGIGHLSHPSRTSRVLFAVAHSRGQWTWAEPDDSWSFTDADNVLLVMGSLAPDVGWEGWMKQPHPLPGVVHLTRDGEAPVSAHGGLAMLGNGLFTRWSHETLPADALSRAMARRLLYATGNPPRDVATALKRGHLRVRPRGGLDDPDPNTAALTLDEALLLFDDQPIALRFDDPPDAWRQPSDHVVARVTVERDFGRGWLELPRPYDATLGVVWTWLGQAMTVPSVDQRWPCRGAIRATRALTEDDLAVLHIEARRLYQQLDDEDNDASAYIRALPARTAPDRSALQRALHRTFGSTLVWLDGGPTQITRTSRGRVEVCIGTPHAAMLDVPDTRAAAFLDLVTRVARASGVDPTVAIDRATPHLMEWVGLPA